MQLVLVLVVILSLASVGWSETVCVKYATALFGADNVTTEIALIQTVINATVGLLLADPTTFPWFNGVNNGINFTDPSQNAALQNLYNHLYLFFGYALGCSAWNPTPATTNMQLIHQFNQTGQKFITKAAFERFNQLVSKVLLNSNVAQADVIAVGQSLDGFRTGSGTPTNQICQGPDCATSPYGVTVSSAGTSATNNFLPAYYSIPYGYSLAFTTDPTTTLATHTITLSNQALNATSSCPVSYPGFNVSPFLAAGYTTPPLNVTGNNWIACLYHCGSGMYMVADVGTAPTVAPTTKAPTSPVSPTASGPVSPTKSPSPTKAPSTAATNALPVFLATLLFVMAVLL